ncbi:hypothetical protein D3C77_505340 [compost metagenome]
MDAIYEVAVDLHIVRAQFRPQPQARIPRAQVIQGNRKTHVAVVVQGIEQQLEIVGGGLLGQLDHYPAGRQPQVVEHFQGAPGLILGFQQRLGRDVEKQLALQLLLAEASAGAFPAGHFQLGQAPGLAGDGKQIDR